jgi:hypothetical protein
LQGRWYGWYTGKGSRQRKKTVVALVEHDVDLKAASKWYPFQKNAFANVVQWPCYSPVTRLFMLKNLRGLLSSQSNSGVHPPSARSVSLKLGAVATLGTPMLSPVPILIPPTLPRVFVLIPVLNECIVLVGLGGSKGLVGESSSCHGPPKRAMIRRCSESRQRCFCSAVGGGSRGDMSV